VREETLVEQWVYIGRIRSHSRAITGLAFGMSGDGFPLLASVGEDRRLVQYNLMASSITAGVVVDGERSRVEQTAVPTACMWYPLNTPSVGDATGVGATPAPEQLLVTASDEYKFKLWNSSSRACRLTKVCVSLRLAQSLAHSLTHSHLHGLQPRSALSELVLLCALMHWQMSPTFGGPINSMVRVTPAAPESKLDDGGETLQAVAYSTADRVVGLTLLPLTGNPNHSMGLVAHPRKVPSSLPLLRLVVAVVDVEFVSMSVSMLLLSLSVRTQCCCGSWCCAPM
jgi:hypothetical protein